MEHRVAITGIGAVTPLGNTTTETWEAMCAGCCGIGPITRIDTEGLSVGVDVEPVPGVHAALRHSLANGASDTRGLRVRTRDVVGVIGVAIANNLGIYARPASDGVLPLLESKHAPALAHDEAVALGVEGAACRRRIRVGAERTARSKPRDHLADDGCLCATREDGVRITVLDRAERLAHRVG